MRGAATPGNKTQRITFGLAFFLPNAPPEITQKGSQMTDEKVRESSAHDDRDETTPTPTAEELAEAWRKHPGFGAYHWYNGEWVWLSTHGTGYSKCGSRVPPPKPEDIKPHQKLLWAKCKDCGAIKPWGGCGSKSISSYNSTWQK